MILSPEHLTQDAFAVFGTVIENPQPSLIPSANLKNLPQNAQLGNQGSAIVYPDVSQIVNLYASAPSRVSAKAIMNMFVCAPRALLPSQNSDIEGSFPVEILERHPYTSQTFIPLGLAPSEAAASRYLVIVAPSLPPSPADEQLPVPDMPGLPGRNLPELSKIKAFVVKGSQAVTYGAGTWHAPMVVLGNKPVDFVVVQFKNGVEVEDCQIVEWKAEKREEVLVAIPKSGRSQGLWKL